MEVNASIELVENSMSSFFDITAQRAFRYKALPYQIEVYNSLYPNQEDDIEKVTHELDAPYFITQAYALDQDINVSRISKIVNHLCFEHRVLRTIFSRNDKILDADVEGSVERIFKDAMDRYAYLDVIDVMNHPKLAVISTQTLTAFTHEYLENINRLDKPFSLVLIRDSLRAPAQPAKNIFILIASTAICDEITCSWFMREVCGLYSKMDSNDVPPYEGVEEDQDFLDFVNDADIDPRKALAYYKDLTHETVQDDVVHDRDRDKILEQLARLESEQLNLKAQKDHLTKKHIQFDSELQHLKEERTQLEKEENSGEMTKFYDLVTNEVIEISPKAREILVKVVLGEKAGNDNVEALLKKHEVEDEVIEKIGGKTMKLEEFARIDERFLNDRNMFTKHKRKLLALSEYVRNRLRECLQEQAKIKFALERQILKTARDSEDAKDKLSSVTDKLDNTLDMIMRFSYILNPPAIESKILPVSFSQLEGKTDGVRRGSIEVQVNDNGDVYGFIPIKIDESIIENLRSFRHAYQLKKSHRRSRAVPGENTDDSAFSDVDDLLLSTTAMLKPTDAACLAAYSVLIRHITGREKFLLGVTSSFRTPGVIVGPLSDTLPVQFDMTQKNGTFDGLFGRTLKQIRKAKRFGLNCPSSIIGKTQDIQVNFPIRFEFITQADTEKWLKDGLKMEDFWTEKGNFIQSEALDIDRLWSMNEREKYDLKVVLAERGDEVVGGFRYRKDKFDEEKILKWIEKYETILHNVEYSSKKIQVSHMLSRLYQSIWSTGASISSLVDLSRTTSCSLSSILSQSEADVNAENSE